MRMRRRRGWSGWYGAAIPAGVIGLVVTVWAGLSFGPELVRYVRIRTM
jgi:hypothetical protein